MTFFRGTPDGQGAHEDLAQRIGVIGKIWARDHVRRAFSSFARDVWLTLMCLFSRAVEKTR